MNIIRAKVRDKLMQVEQYPLTVVTAPIGYGKTTAIYTVSNQQGVKVEWYDEKEPIWRPREQYVEPTWVVLDNYHLISDVRAYCEGLVEIAKKQIEHLHIVLVMRSIPEISLEELKMKRICQVIEERDLRFTDDEVMEYLREAGMQVEPILVEKIQEYIEGWPAAVYLMVENDKQYGTWYHNYRFYNILREGIYKFYDEIHQKLLIFLGGIGKFKLQDLKYLPQYKLLRNAVDDLVKDNVFLKYYPETGNYKMVKVFADFLDDQLSLLPEDLHQTICKDIGEYQLRKSNWETGFGYLVRGKNFKEILEWLQCQEIQHTAHVGQLELGDLLEVIDESLWHEYPIAHLRVVYYKLMKMNKVEGSKWLDQIEKQYQEISDLTEEMRSRIQGEIEAIRALAVCQSVECMKMALERAYQYNPEGSSIVKATDLLTKERLHLSYLYHTQVGGYRQQIENMVGALGLMSKKKYGMELEYLMQAEYCMYTGQWEEAKSNAKKVFYKADILGNDKVRLCGEFILARIALSMGEYEKGEQYIAAMQDYKPYSEIPCLESMREIGIRYLQRSLGSETYSLKELDMKEMLLDRESVQGATSLYLAYAQTFLAQKEWIKLEILEDAMGEQLLRDEQLIGKLYYYLFNAIIAEHNKKRTEAETYLGKAIEIGAPDGIILPFMEHMKEIRGILEGIKVKQDSREYVQSMLEGHALQKAPHLIAKTTLQDKWGLTKREWQIVKLIEQGLTNKQIAEQLFVANVTIAKTTSNIYRKMGVGNRIEMISLVKG